MVRGQEHNVHQAGQEGNLTRARAVTDSQSLPTAARTSQPDSPDSPDFMGFSDFPDSTDTSTSEPLPSSSSGDQSNLILQGKQETKL